MKGNKTLVFQGSGLANGGFEDNFSSWAADGDARILTRLSGISSREGSKMAIISTGLGSVSDSSSYLMQTFQVPQGSSTLSLDVNVVSEEPMEFVGTIFDDRFKGYLIDKNDELQTLLESVPETTPISLSDFEGTWTGLDEYAFQEVAMTVGAEGVVEAGTFGTGTIHITDFLYSEFEATLLSGEVTTQITGAMTNEKLFLHLDWTNNLDELGWLQMIRSDYEYELELSDFAGNWEGSLEEINEIGETIEYEYTDAFFTIDSDGNVTESTLGTGPITLGEGGSFTADLERAGDITTSLTGALPLGTNAIQSEWSSSDGKQGNLALTKGCFDISHYLPGTQALVYESVNSSNWGEVTGIDFYGGDETTFMTGWKEIEYDISSYSGKTVTLFFRVWDKGDSIYDTAVLIDSIRLE